MRPGGFLRRQTVERVAEAAQSFLALQATWQVAGDSERLQIADDMRAAGQRLRRATGDLDFGAPPTPLAGDDERWP